MSAPVAADAEVVGDKTMMVPPPTPAWAPSQDAALGGLPPAPPSTLPPPPSPAEGLSTPSSGGFPASSGGFPASSGGFQAASGSLPASSGGFPAASGSLPPADPESTAAWTFDPDDDLEDDPAPGSGPGTGGAPAAFGAAPPPPPPSWAGAGAGPSPYGTEPPAESIVPDSWFAPARTPDEQPQGAAQSPQQQATQQWAPQQPPAGDSWSMDATQVALPAHQQQQPLDASATMMDQGRPQFDGNATMLDQGMPHPNAPFSPGMDPHGMQPHGMQPGGYPGPGGPMGPHGMPVDPAYGGQPPPRSSGGVSKALVITVAALVVVALVTVGLVMWPEGEKKPPAAKPPATTAPNKKVSDDKPLPVATKQQAMAVHRLLNASAQTRRELAAAIGKTRKCEDLPAAMTGFQGVAQRRQNQLRRTNGLKLDKLSRGEQLRAALRQSFQGSLEVDQALMTWAQQAQQNCNGKPKPDATQAPGRAAAERKATLGKKQLVKLWNPIAKKTGHPQRRWNGV
ncbi:hypothetical protein [Actinomadura rudentiformis]|uniref:Uncharacterized protein n=1 Tax=Actinomadura rudentiformis TaxID=359158 RepID=A0A6H9YYQ3_9ACTN|nr:hypothetical protein [Actinomadura rudentiformis]KAB2347867.1 hypothetical protein F8566_18460 [Actinomadura rudentiformis]